MQDEETREQVKQRIIALFNLNVRGKRSDTTGANSGHDGRDGHWLETQMGVTHNAKNEADIDGFEMKNHTQSRTTFGDWSSDYSIFTRRGKPSLMTKDAFLNTFAAPNPDKENRYSWSGRNCPKINDYNHLGQKFEIDNDNNILAVYCYSRDTRENKDEIVPQEYRQEHLVLLSWSAALLRVRIQKFNKLGWFKCNKVEGVYTSIVFGNPINFETFIQGVRDGLIFLDSGMTAGKSRLYSSWRANNTYWTSLITDTY